MNGASAEAGAMRWARMSSQCPSPPQKPSEARSSHTVRLSGGAHTASANGISTMAPASGV